MGFWNRPVNRNALSDIEGLSHPPETGGRVKMVVLGILVPLAAILYAWHGWHTGKIWMPGQHDGAMLIGPGAQWLTLCYFSAGLAAHFRWFWGLLSIYRIFEWGTTAALILWISGCSGMLYYEFFY